MNLIRMFMYVAVMLCCTTLYSCLKVGEAPTKAEQINLALRQVGDQLYRYCGDTSTKIPPVQIISDTEFQLELVNGVEYDILPELMEKTLKDFGITDTYIVSILDCFTEDILLGYNTVVADSEVIACRGREKDDLCNIINLKMYGLEKSENQSSSWLFTLLGCIVFLVLLNRFRNKKPEIEPITNSETIKEDQIEKVVVNTNSSLLKIGDSTFDPKALTITHGEEVKNLTYREAKLFEYFVDHKNEVLKRDDIQTHVWEDEGVIVGRSLDVFISRLRKIIKSDNSLSIKNIHGVGYRLEEIG